MAKSLPPTPTDRFLNSIRKSVAVPGFNSPENSFQSKSFLLSGNVPEVVLANTTPVAGFTKLICILGRVILL